MFVLGFFFWNILSVQPDQRLRAAKKRPDPLRSVSSVYPAPSLVLKVSEDVHLSS